MEALKRTPVLSVKKEFELPDGTKIGIRQIKARVLAQNASAKNMSDTERGLRIMAAKLLVNGREICYDDLLDCFNDEEMNIISSHIAGEDDAEKNV